MSTMLDATERTRPILQYVRDLEQLVRTYRNRERRFNGGIFAMGFAAGAAAVWLVRMLIH